MLLAARHAAACLLRALLLDRPSLAGGKAPELIDEGEANKLRPAIVGHPWATCEGLALLMAPQRLRCIIGSRWLAFFNSQTSWAKLQGLPCCVVKSHDEVVCISCSCTALKPFCAQTLRNNCCALCSLPTARLAMTSSSSSSSAAYQSLPSCDFSGKASESAPFKRIYVQSKNLFGKYVFGCAHF